jgi:ABC-2 type transport system permease protein
MKSKRTNFWQSFRTATWLGWKIESNWTDPFLFFIYSIVKPITGASIVVIMFSVITHSDFSSPMFAYMFIGNTFYQYVAAIMTGVSWAIVDDREHYRTLKYIYTAPVHIPLYLIGRGVARFLTATFAVIILMVFGIFILHIPIQLVNVNWGLFLLAMALGAIMLSMIGLLLAGIALNTVRQNFFIGDVVAGSFFLLCGVIYPLDILPNGIRQIGYFIPVTYWIELIRRSFVGNIAQAFPTFTQLSDLQLVLILLGTAVIFGVIGYFSFVLFDRRAREKGFIDWSTSY